VDAGESTQNSVLEVSHLTYSPRRRTHKSRTIGGTRENGIIGFTRHSEPFNSAVLSVTQTEWIGRSW